MTHARKKGSLGQYRGEGWSHDETVGGALPAHSPREGKAKKAKTQEHTGSKSRKRSVKMDVSKRGKRRSVSERHRKLYPLRGRAGASDAEALSCHVLLTRLDDQEEESPACELHPNRNTPKVKKSRMSRENPSAQEPRKRRLASLNAEAVNSLLLETAAGPPGAKLARKQSAGQEPAKSSRTCQTHTRKTGSDRDAGEVSLYTPAPRRLASLTAATLLKLTSSHRSRTAGSPNTSSHRSRTAGSPNTSSHRSRTAGSPNTSSHRSRTASSQNTSSQRSRNTGSPNTSSQWSRTAGSSNTSSQRSRNTGSPNTSSHRSRTAGSSNTSSQWSRTAGSPNTSSHRSRTASSPNTSSQRSRTAGSPNTSSHRSRTASSPNTSSHRSRTASSPNTSSQRSRAAGSPNTSSHRSRTAGSPNTSSQRSRAAGSPNTSSHRSRAAGSPNTSSQRSRAAGSPNTSSHRSRAAGSPNTSSHRSRAAGSPNTSSHRSRTAGSLNTSSHRSRTAGSPNTSSHRSRTAGSLNTSSHRSRTAGSLNTSSHRSRTAGSPNTSSQRSRTAGSSNTSSHRSRTNGSPNTSSHRSRADSRSCRPRAQRKYSRKPEGACEVCSRSFESKLSQRVSKPGYQSRSILGYPVKVVKEEPVEAELSPYCCCPPEGSVEYCHRLALFLGQEAEEASVKHHECLVPAHPALALSAHPCLCADPCYSGYYVHIAHPGPAAGLSAQALPCTHSPFCPRGLSGSKLLASGIPHPAFCGSVGSACYRRACGVGRYAFSTVQPLTSRTCSFPTSCSNCSHPIKTGFSPSQDEHNRTLLVPPALPLSGCPSMPRVNTSSPLDPRLLSSMSDRRQAKVRLKVGKECPQNTKPSNSSLTMGQTKLSKQPTTSPASANHQRGVSQHQPTNGWRPVGVPTEKEVFIAGDDETVLRQCYEGVERDGEVIRVRDTVLLRSGPRKKSLPYVAKISALWEDPRTGELMMSLFWYYRPEHTQGGRDPSMHCENEIFASRHQDENSVACIEDRCYVLPLAQYCRFCALAKRRSEGVSESTPVVPVSSDSAVPSHRLVPDGVDPELVYLCRHVYDFRYGRILKNLQ